MQAEAHGYSFGEQRELVEIRILDVRYLRSIVLAWTDIDIGSLVGGEGGVLLCAVDLSEKSVRVIAIEMKEREFCSAATDIKFGRAIVQARPEHAGEPTVKPVWKEVAGQLRRYGAGFAELEEFTRSMNSAIV